MMWSAVTIRSQDILTRNARPYTLNYNQIMAVIAIIGAEI